MEGRRSIGQYSSGMKNFGLAGLIFNMEHTKMERCHDRVDEHTTLDGPSSEARLGCGFRTNLGAVAFVLVG